MTMHQSQYAQSGANPAGTGGESMVGKHESHYPGPIVEVTLAKTHVRVQIDDEAAPAPMAFHLSAAAVQQIRNDYRALDALADGSDEGQPFKDLEKEVGRALAGFLLRTKDGQDNELANKLNDTLSELDQGQYVRLLLSFEDENLSHLPWELTHWESVSTGREICLGRHGDIALSRLERPQPGVLRKHPTGRDGVLSILHIGTDDKATTVFDRTRALLRKIDEHIPQVHTASRQTVDLNQYWIDCFKILGRYPEIDIVHWDGHGSSDSVRFKARDGSFVTLTASELLERTRGAFLYVVQCCRSGGDIGKVVKQSKKKKAKAGGAPPPPDPRTFSSALLDHGASAVLGIHDAVATDRFQHLPILYALLFHGLPLDHCVQFMRRFFWLDNAERQRGPYEPWYKLMLRTNRVSYLDGAPPANPAPPSRDLILLLEALVTPGNLQTPVDGAKPGAARAAPDTWLKRLYETVLRK